ncbi:hypothetical protein AYK24_08990 [Thermoplasmatales archaeon SG8-52-4]|nr:MAG: hypothetical protein AYK24_08990 [Thermoplasmatales archaeon SG8-52-4]
MFLIIITCIFFSLVNLSVLAEEGQAEISIKGTPTYKLISQNTSGNRIVSRYKIYITFENSGNVSSDQIKVNLTDPDGFILDKTFKIEPAETKLITFDWSTIFTDDQELKINYRPTDFDTIKTKDNSGKTTLTIKVVNNNDDGSTPGFEMVVISIALLFSILIIRYRNKKY